MDLLKIARQTQEAYCVSHGIPVTRQFSDAELAPSHDHIADAERDLYGMTRDERLGRLSPDEQAQLNELNGRTMIPFRVSVTVPGHAPEQIGLIAVHACDAITKAMEIMFPDFDSVKPETGLAIKVEAIKSTTRKAA